MKHTYGNRPVVDYDPDKRAQAAGIKVRAARLGIDVSRCLSLADAKAICSRAALMDEIEAGAVAASIALGQPAFDAAIIEIWPGVEKYGIASGRYPDPLVTGHVSCISAHCPLVDEPEQSGREAAGYGQMGPF